VAAAAPRQRQGFLARYFHTAERGTSPRTELLGGVATFLTMSYIVFVNPAILSAAGVPLDAVVVGTASSSPGGSRGRLARGERVLTPYGQPTPAAGAGAVSS
jgi:xanthine/uracil/vitamin C permease (AzgA family)